MQPMTPGCILFDVNRTDIAALADRLGRKFETSDVTEPLYLAARDYLTSYRGDFAYLVDLQGRSSLSAGQAKGVLNCLVADERRSAARKPAARTAAPALSVAGIPDGRYRVVAADSNSISVRLAKAAWATDKPAGTRSVAVLTGEGWFNLGLVSPEGALALWRKADPYKARLLPALDTLAKADDTLVYGLAYAVEGNECWICGSELDTEASIAAGYGPTCAKNRDLPWGDKAVPAQVLLARAAAAAEAPVATTAVSPRGAAHSTPGQASRPAPAAPAWPPTTAHVFPFDGWWLLSRDDGREIVPGARRFPTKAGAEHALAGGGIVGPAYDSPAADYPRSARSYDDIFGDDGGSAVLADDDELEPLPLPKRPAARISRWSRPGDDELEHAAFG